MKNFYLVLIFVFTSLFSFAQEEVELFGEWFLSYRAYGEGATYPPFTTEEDYNIILNFGLLPPSASNPFIIESYGPTTTTYEGRFEVENGIMYIFNVEETVQNCEHPELVCSFFEDYNHDILFDPDAIIESGEYAVTYEVTGTGDDAVLTITNDFNIPDGAIGDRAVYGREALSIDNNDYVLSITLDKNPVDNILSFTLGNGLQDYFYEIYSITGKRITTGVLNSNTIRVNELQSGLYFVIISKDENSFEPLKFIKK